MRRNIESLLGARVWLWWWSCHSSGNGLSFPVAEGSEEPWPPQDSHGNEHGIKNPVLRPVGEKVTYNLDAEYLDRNYHDAVSLKPRRAILFTASSATDEN